MEDNSTRKNTDSAQEKSPEPPITTNPLLKKQKAVKRRMSKGRRLLSFIAAGIFAIFSLAMFGAVLGGSMGLLGGLISSFVFLCLAIYVFIDGKRGYKIVYIEVN